MHKIKLFMENAKEIYQQLRERQIISSFADEMGLHRNTIRNVFLHNKKPKWHLVEAAVKFIKDYDDQIKEYKQKFAQAIPPSA